MLALGARVSRYAATHSGQQLIVALSVPRRDFAAALIASGWVMTRPAPTLAAPLDILRTAKRGVVVRVVTEREVILDRFTRFNQTTDPPRLHLSDTLWEATAIRAVAVIDGVERDFPRRMARPHLGAIGRIARLGNTWDTRLAAASVDLGIIGTCSWLRDDFDVFLSREGDECQLSKALVEDLARATERGTAYRVGFGHGSLLDVVLPEIPKASTAFTKVYASARLADQLPLPSVLRAVVLDGSGAINHLAEIETPVVVCILDRSVADETAAENIVQMRNTRGEPVSVRTDLGWRPPAGVEALAFTVAL
ncbi:hypothetical protein AB0I28_09630 [Phytomonospora sp. NPDC050363]|uniref:hypothetical protein n=1 Tax=Phytomonospora sp. NPDC050363 TaxID=3155642 RepID=UPI0034041561